MQSRKNKSLTTNHKSPRPEGSALILAVVLVSLLAVVGVMFAMVARIDKMSTSAIAENKTLNLAVDTVIAKISQELVLDVPGMPLQEYYDYPDVGNAWLASLEPEVDDKGTPTPLDDIYYWRQISDIYYRFGPQDFWNLRSVIIDDYQEPAEIGDSNGYTGDPNDLYFADADGDGVSDSMWVKLDNITSSKGRPIYAAVRIIDNGAMLNVNTGYKFDPGSSDPNLIDGSSQMQINLMALSWRPWDVYDANDETKLLNERTNYPVSGIDPNDLDGYKGNVVWRYDKPNGAYTPFDISDELEVRNRFFIKNLSTATRLKELWTNSFKIGKWTPVDSNIPDWFMRVADADANTYSYRHIATNYNMDRIINPVGPTLNSGRMVSINNPADANANVLYSTLLASIDPNITGGVLTLIKGQFAQLAANIVDFADGDIAVTVLEPNDPNIGSAYYGFDAQPFITEIGFIIDGEPLTGRNYYAVELYNPFSQDISLADFKLVLIDSNDPLSPFAVDFNSSDVIPADGHFVIANDLSRFNIDPNNTNTKEGPILVFFGGWQPPLSVAPPPPPGPPIGIAPPSPPKGAWKYSYTLYLTRKVGDPNNPDEIYVDRQRVDSAGAGVVGYFGRDVRDWHIVYDTQKLFVDSNSTNGTLGRFNNIYLDESNGHRFSFFLPNRPQKFVTVGDIPRVLTIGHGDELNSTIGEQLFWRPKDEERLVRLDLQNPNYSNIFQYLTVFAPSTDGIDNDGDGPGDETDPNLTPELKIPGRININTAPWYVIAQLPWMTPELAQAIVAYRDKFTVPVNYSVGRNNATGMSDLREDLGFASIGELATVINNTGALAYDMHYYALDINDLDRFPDLTVGDGIINDFEERDVIFSRISNLVTVRSDVFTAHILVRIGNDGPQKRAIAILDRSDVYPIPSGGYIGRVKMRALHPVPDPR